MRVGFCRADDPLKKSSWSGTPHFMFKALEKHFPGEIVSLGPLPNKFILPAKVLRQLSILLTRKKYHYSFSSIVNYEYARVLSKKLRDAKCDVLFFPAASGILAYIKTDLPCVYLSDATFRTMTGYHWNFTNLWEFNRRRGEIVESLAISKAEASIFASAWAVKSAVQDYGSEESSTYTVPFGANLHTIPSEGEVLSRRGRIDSPCKLLFVGVNWEAKGGGIAIDACLELNRRGVRCEITLVGSAPPEGINLECVRFVGFLDKNTSEGMRALQKLYMDTDFFILPTRNEAAGIVLCEASAYGVPCIATNTGGVPTYVEDGVTGYLCELDDPARIYADRIESLVNRPNQYLLMAKRARSKFEKELNWDVWGERVARVLLETVKQHEN